MKQFSFTAPNMQLEPLAPQPGGAAALPPPESSVQPSFDFGDPPQPPPAILLGPHGRPIVHQAQILTGQQQNYQRELEQYQRELEYNRSLTDWWNVR
jgi:hypothetical protein